MKAFSLAILTALLLSYCQPKTNTNETPAPLKPPVAVQADSSVLYALQQLHNEIKTGGTANSRVNAKSEEIVMGDSLVRVKITTEFAGQKQGQWIYAANFITDLKKGGQENKFNVGAIGFGINQQDAFFNCVAQWMSTFGRPFANLVNNKNGTMVNGFEVFAGQMDVKGSLPQTTWLKGDEAMTSKIITKIKTVITANTENVVPVDIKLLVENGKAKDGDCRVGNVVSYELLKKLKTLNWPVTKEKFLFSQFYLVKK